MSDSAKKSKDPRAWDSSVSKPVASAKRAKLPDNAAQHETPAMTAGLLTKIEGLQLVLLCLSIVIRFPQKPGPETRPNGSGLDLNAPKTTPVDPG